MPRLCMIFWYSNIYLIFRTVSNCDDEEDDSDGSVESNLEAKSEVRQKRNSRELKRKRKNSEENLSSSIVKVAEAINASNKDIVLPPPPEPTEIDGCLNVIGNRLKKVPEIKQSDAVQKMLELSYELYKEFTG